MMGVGLLSLPFALKSSGWIGLVVLWVMGIATNYTAKALCECADVVNQRRGASADIVGYEEIAEASFGRLGRLIISAIIYVELFGTCALLFILEVRHHAKPHSLSNAHGSCSDVPQFRYPHTQLSCNATNRPQPPALKPSFRKCRLSLSYAIPRNKRGHILVGITLLGVVFVASGLSLVILGLLLPPLCSCTFALCPDRATTCSSSSVPAPWRLIRQCTCWWPLPW